MTEQRKATFQNSLMFFNYYFMRTIYRSLVLISVWLLVMDQSSFAQQIPLFSQYFHNQFIYNPAWAGNYDYGSANFTYRNQWAGLDGAPTTMLATIDVPFYEYRCGFGLNISQDNIKVSSQTKAMATYAYHIFGPYENSSKLSLGFSGGFLYNRINMDKLFVQHPNDPNLVNNSGNFTSFEAAFGANYIYRNVFQVSLVLPQLINPSLTALDAAENNINLTQHLMLSSKYIWTLPDGYTRLEPMVMVRKSMNAPWQFEGGMLMSYANFMWGAVTYREKYGAVAAVGINHRQFRFGYARDFAVSDLAGVAGGGNEIMIGYKFKQIPTVTYAGQKGVGSGGLTRRKVYHPSRPNPFGNKGIHKRKAPKKYYKTRGRYKRIEP